jgi:membrane-associated phospholipid phosphatase
MAALVWSAARVTLSLRDWLPGAYILAAYYITGWLFVAPSPRLESWLAAWDRRVLGDPATRFARWPRAFVAYLEIVYMFCFLIVPAGLAALVLAGHASRIDRYWTMVLTAELGAFAPLTVFQTRPPWALERKPVLTDPAVHRAASRMVQHLTIRANTFPSGHVAGSLAVALAVAPLMPVAGAVFGLLAVSISAACVVGRYHYVMDVAAGAVLALATWVAVGLSGL